MFSASGNAMRYVLLDSTIAAANGIRGLEKIGIKKINNINILYRPTFTCQAMKTQVK